MAIKYRIEQSPRKDAWFVYQILHGEDCMMRGVKTIENALEFVAKHREFYGAN